MDKSRLFIAFCFIWFVISLPLSNWLYDGFDDSGISMWFFAWLLTLSPIWITVGWHLIFTDKPKSKIFVVVTTLVYVIYAFFVYNTFWDRDTALIPILSNIAFILFHFSFTAAYRKNSLTEIAPDAQKTSLTYELEKDSSPHPWPRFFARVLDWLLIGTPIIFLLLVLVPSRTVEDYIGFPYITIFTIIAYALIWIPTESYMISKFGTTPMKWAFGITIRKHDGSLLSYSDAIKRTYFCFVQGEGLGIPFVTLITRLVSYQTLSKTKTTLWDKEVGSVVYHKPFTLWRMVGCITLVVFGLFVMGVLNSLKFN